MIKANLNHNYAFDPQRVYDFSEHMHKLTGISLYYGYTPTDGVDKVHDTNLKVCFIVEYPNSFYITRDDVGLNIHKNNDNYDLVFSICPYTCKLLNEKFNTNKYKPIFFPLMPYKYDEVERIYPVFYSGHIFSNVPIIHAIDTVINNYLGFSTYSGLKSLIAEPSINSYYRKLNIYSRTKICIAHNVLYKPSIPEIDHYLTDELYNKHLPWQTNSDIYTPQIKSRVFEGAMMGCILLVYRDNYNLIETYFTENEDFIYFTDQSDLESKIDLILRNYDDYKYLAKNAQTKFYNNYTLEHFVDIIKAECDSIRFT